MTAKFIPLCLRDPDGHELVGNQIKGEYLDGLCYEFAVAVSEGLGWPMVGIMAQHNGKETIRHVVLLKPNWSYFDARGYVDEEDLGKPFGLESADYKLRTPIELADIEAIRPVNERGVRIARQLAEAYWPELPWKDSLKHRATRFAEELEQLSRKHGIWIYGHLPTTWPGLSESDGEDELGYTVTMDSNGLGARINRRQIHEE